MNETLVQIGNNLTLGQIYKPKSKENKLLVIQRDMDCTLIRFRSTIGL